MNKISNNSSFLEKIIETQSRLTHADFNLDAFMNLVAEQMHLLTPATGVVVELVDGNDMVYRATTGTVATHLGLRLSIENSISGLCIRTNQVLRSDDTEIDSRVNLEACRKVAARSLVVTPLVYQDRTVGVLKILSKEPNAFSETDVKTLQVMAGFIASGLAHQLSYEENNRLLTERTSMLNELERAQEKLHHFAHHDTLTNLANRRTFTEKLVEMMGKSKRKSAIIALMFLDIDHFKNVNDVFGHDTGDNLLKTVAHRLKQCVRDYDVVARIGGDEFVIILDDIDDQGDVFSTAENIMKKMGEKFKFGDIILTISASIGIAFYNKEKISPDEFLKQADSALYKAKHAGRNTYEIFNKEDL